MWIQFAAWVPSDHIHGGPAYNFTAIGEYLTVESPQGQNLGSKLRLMIASTNDNSVPGGMWEGVELNSLTVHECTLHNASYLVDFDFRYPNQRVTIRSLQIHEAMVSSPYNDVYMEDDNYTGFHSRRLSYRGVMDAFGSIFVGGSYLSTSPGGTLFVNVMTQSEYNSNRNFGGGRYLQTSVQWLYANETGRSFEKLFQNITLSLLSVPELTTNETTGSNISARITTFPNTYVYSPFDLWLPYGIAIAATVVCVAIGFEAMIRNGATYSNRFYTILRTTRDGHFDDLVEASDDGSDPLPKKIAQAKLSHEGHRDLKSGTGTGRGIWRRDKSRSRLRWATLSHSDKT